MWLWILACDFSASTKVVGFDTAADDSNADSNADTEASAETATDSDDSPRDSTDDTAHPSDIDDDNDGYTENQGDCDDASRTVHPDTTDGCDAVDTDCDGTVDEDAPGDDFEPNDIGAYDLGSLEDDPDQSAAAWLQNEDDVDRFQFTIVDDTFDFFSLNVEISNLPADATYLVTINRVRSDGDSELAELDQQFATGSYTWSYGDTSGYEDGGDYEIVISNIGGASCEHTYLLAVSQ